MSIIRTIGGREALPVWALPYVTNWKEAPDSLLRTLANRDGRPRRDGLTTYRTNSAGKVVSITPGEWVPYLELVDIETRIQKQQEIAEYERYKVWRTESVRLMPGDAFVYLGEFSEWFVGSISVFNGEDRKPYVFRRVTAAVGDHVVRVPFDPEDFRLILDPIIPTEIKEHFGAWFNAKPPAENDTQAPVPKGAATTQRETQTQADGTRKRGRGEGKTTALWAWGDPFIRDRMDWKPSKVIREIRRIVQERSDPGCPIIRRSKETNDKGREVPGFWWQGSDEQQIFVTDKTIINRCGNLRKDDGK